MESNQPNPTSVKVTVDGGQIMAYHYASTSPRGAALLAHGGPGGDHRGPSGIFEILAEMLVSHGIDCWTFDARGCGDSSGSPDKMCVRTLKEDLQAVARMAFHRGGTRLLIGESLGAVSIVEGIQVVGATAAVLLWPALSLADTDLRGLLTPENLRALSDSGVADLEWTKLGREFAEDIVSCQVYSRLLDIDVPMLILHGTADREVPVHQSRIAHTLTSRCSKLVLVEGGGHGLRKPDEQELVRKTVAGWIEGIAG